MATHLVSIYFLQITMTAVILIDNFILPAPPVGGLTISQDWLDRMKLIRDRTIPSSCQVDTLAN